MKYHDKSLVCMVDGFNDFFFMFGMQRYERDCLQESGD